MKLLFSIEPEKVQRKRLGWANSKNILEFLFGTLCAMPCQGTIIASDDFGTAIGSGQIFFPLAHVHRTGIGEFLVDGCEAMGTITLD